MKDAIYPLFQKTFWLWNILFLSIVYLGLLPFVGIPLIVFTLEGLIPVDFFLTLVLLIAVPTICSIIAAKSLQGYPLQLIRFFYGVEAPLFVLCLIRLFLIRELTPGSALIVYTGVACIFAFGFHLLYGYRGKNPLGDWLQLGIHSLIALIGLYVGLILLFYVSPVFLILLKSFFSFKWLLFLGEVFIESPPSLVLIVVFFLLWVMLFFFSGALFLAMPCSLATFYVDSGYKIWHNFSAKYGRKRAILLSGSIVTAWLVMFLTFQQQPQVQAFKLLERPPESDQIRQELLASSDVIRNGLVNAYLVSYRYLSTTEANNHIRSIYRDFLKFNDAQAQFFQDRYNQLMSPFLYQGSRSDREKAAKLYGEFFDTPIQKGDRQSVLKALKSTFNGEEAKAGVLNINEHRALVVKQEINIQEHEDWADVELYEVYENQTTEDEEIFYYFSLPESAVVTGLWLGETADRGDRYTFQVSPRGAAQQVYNEQVQRQVDPALLEQVGPRHYRLRVYPIPARRTISDNQRKQHLWLTYKVMQENGGWPLPRLAEKRNVFWDYRTRRIYNGQKVRSWMNVWLPESLPASQKIFKAVHQVSLPGNYQLSAKPLKAEDYTLPQGQRFAVIIDRSYSMKAHGKEVSKTIDWLKSQGFADDSLANNDADIFLTASAGAQPERLDNFRGLNPQKITFYGTLQYPEMLQQFESLRGTTAYDAILLVTDGGTYELADDKVDNIRLSAPLWMIHLGEFPRAYDDATLQAIQASGGGVGTDISQVLQRVATQAKLGDAAVTVVDGYAWLLNQPKSSDITSIEATLAALDESKDESDFNGFEPLAARQLILSLTKEIQGNKLAELDAVHAIAKRFKIVSPYSSMIVLVNQWQEQALKEAEAKSDRFDREVEKGNEQLTQPNDMMSVAAPEPTTFLGSLGAIAFLIVAKRKLGKSPTR